MDPFSLVVGSLSLIDACQRFTTFVLKVYRGGKTIDEDLRALFEQVKDLEKVIKIIKDIDDKREYQIAAADNEPKSKLGSILSSIAGLLPKCESIIDQLYNILKSVEAAHLPRLLEGLDKFYKELKRKIKESDFLVLQRSLRDYHETLQMLLQAANYCIARESQSRTERNANDIYESFVTLNGKLDELKSRLEYAPSGGFSKAFAAVKAIVALDSNNKYFDIPQSVSSIFTGRDAMLDKLQTWMFEISPSTRASLGSHRSLQKRFVVYGLGGSGKTQFCCKFAQEHRERFAILLHIPIVQID